MADGKQHRRCRVVNLADIYYADGAENLADPSGGSVSNDDARPGIIFNVDGEINMDQDGNPQGVFRDSGDGSKFD